MAVADRHGLPVAVSIASALPHEVTLVEQTMAEMIVPDSPVHLIGDNAYDSDKLDAVLVPWGIEMMAPHRSNRRNSTQAVPYADIDADGKSSASSRDSRASED